MAKEGKKKAGRKPSIKPTLGAQRMRLFRQRQRNSRGHLKRKAKATLTVQLKHYAPPQVPPRIFHGSSSEDWLGEDAPWTLTKARKMAKDYICFRFLPGPFFTGDQKVTDRVGLRKAGVEMLVMDPEKQQYRKWLSIKPSKAKLVDDYKDKDRGMGLFAQRPFATGDVITQFCGKKLKK